MKVLNILPEIIILTIGRPKRGLQVRVEGVAGDGSCVTGPCILLQGLAPSASPSGDRGASVRGCQKGAILHLVSYNENRPNDADDNGLFFDRSYTTKGPRRMASSKWLRLCTTLLEGVLWSLLGCHSALVQDRKNVCRGAGAAKFPP